MAPLQPSSWSHAAHRPAHSKSSPMQLGIVVVFAWVLLLSLGQLASTRAPGCLTHSRSSEALSGQRFTSRSLRGSKQPRSKQPAWAWTPRGGRARRQRQAMVALAGCRRDDAFLQGHAAGAVWGLPGLIAKIIYSRGCRLGPCVQVGSSQCQCTRMPFSMHLSPGRLRRANELPALHKALCRLRQHQE